MARVRDVAETESRKVGSAQTVQAALLAELRRASGLAAQTGATFLCPMRQVRKIVKTLLPGPVLRRIEREYSKETHINRALSRFPGETTYVEIGVRYGECIRQIKASKRIAIDPAPLPPDGPVWNGVELRKQRSDDYFHEVAPDELASRLVNVALADGFHEFRQTLRDVLNLEPFMSPRGVVYIHDCNPPTRLHAEDMNGQWNGDVWKVAYYLRNFRPDLKYFTLDCDWGLGVVSGFSRKPPAPNEREVERVAALDYEVLASDRKRILNLKSPLLFGTRW
jgi:hypothetical protein